MEYNIGKDLSSSDRDEIENLVIDILDANMVSSVVRSGNPAQQVVIKTKYIETEQIDSVFKALASKYENQNLTKDDCYIYNVNPTVGETLTKNTIFSVGLAAVLMLLYITFRFNFLSGLAAVLCLIFDMYVMLTFYSIFQIPINTTVIAAFLTILGYSINATIIIFDRVRENMSLKKGTGMKFPEIINLSACQTMARSVNTTITTLVTITCIFIIGVPSIRNFVMPLMVGLTSGLFSSVCLSGPLWDFFRKDKSIEKGK
jgi:preprotein translocase subunit SecF